MKKFYVMPESRELILEAPELLVKSMVVEGNTSEYYIIENDIKERFEMGDLWEQIAEYI